MELANHCGAWAVFLTWLNLTQLLARFEFFGLGIFMALHVAEKIIKTMLVFTTSFLAFIFGFNMLFQANPAFHGIIGTGVKIFVMMQGEFNFDDNLGYQNVHEHGGRNISIQVKNTFKHTESKEKCNIANFFLSIADSVFSLLDMDGAYFHESIGWFDS